MATFVAGEGDAPRPAFLIGLAVLLGTVTALVGVDVADDARSGGSRGQIAVELLIMAAARAELAAFFLEGLLLPPLPDPAGDPGPTAGRG